MKILIVDDETKVINSITDRIDDLKKQNEFSSLEYLSASCYEAVCKHCQDNYFDMAFVDYLYTNSPKDGYDIAKLLKSKFPNIFVVIISSNSEGFVDLKSKDTLDNTFYIDVYLPKPITNIKDVERSIQWANLHNEKKILEKKFITSRAINLFLTKYGNELNDFQKELLTLNKPIIYYNNIFKNCLEKAAKAAETASNVLITGETGSGKELIANFIHEKSNRNKKPFIKVNCPSIPSTLIESTLFGHEKGSFTSSVKLKIGDFERANGGTLFLDEIGELSLLDQPKILRAIQERKIMRVGGEKEIDINIRIIAATNKNLEDEKNAGNFRPDLYYRINTIPINVPSLRVRGEKDIELLSYYILIEFNIRYNKAVRFDNSAFIKLKTTKHDFPGGVRELENIVTCLAALSVDGIITCDLIKEHANVLLMDENHLSNKNGSNNNDLNNQLKNVNNTKKSSSHDINGMASFLLTFLMEYDNYESLYGKYPTLSEIEKILKPENDKGWITSRFQSKEIKNKNLVIEVIKRNPELGRLKEIPPFKKYY